MAPFVRLILVKDWTTISRTRGAIFGVPTKNSQLARIARSLY